MTTGSIMHPEATLTRNPHLNREIHRTAIMVMCCGAMLTTDVLKSITGYGMKYYNRGAYPFPLTLIVAVVELLKFLVFFSVSATKPGGLRRMRLSAWYALPAVTYVVGNNMHYLALHYTTPPMWSILMQLRVILTALAYRVIFRHTITPTKWMALALLVTGITMSNWRHVEVEGEQTDLLIAVGLATLASCFSVSGSLVMEFLFKNDRREFFDKQTQIYLFSSMCAFGVYVAESLVVGRQDSNSASDSDTIDQLVHVTHTMFVCHILMACFGGFMVAIVVKTFDNIVKQYTQALANMFTAIACSVLFPEFFHLTSTFGFCMILVFVAIIMYESNTVDACWRQNAALSVHVKHTLLRV